MKRDKDVLGRKVSISVSRGRASLPSIVVLYVNFMVGLFWMLDALTLFGGGVIERAISGMAGVTLVAATVMALVGITKGRYRLISFSAWGGYFAWVSSLFVWILNDNRMENFTVPVFCIPMIMFFAHSKLLMASLYESPAVGYDDTK